MEERTCLYCGKIFLSPPSQRKRCCSRSCAGKYNATLGIKPPSPKGRVLSEQTKKKLSDGKKEYYKDKTKTTGYGRTGDKHPMWGKKHSQETRDKIKERIKGKTCGCKNGMYGKTGDKNPNWRGGLSFEPYCPKFNRPFKERVREFFGRVCVECGTPENGTKLSVHHVNFNKMSCCDDTKPLFVALCQSCHLKTNWDREYWEEYFTEMIENYYGGQCYI